MRPLERFKPFNSSNRLIATISFALVLLASSGAVESHKAGSGGTHSHEVGDLMENSTRTSARW